MPDLMTSIDSAQATSESVRTVDLCFLLFALFCILLSLVSLWGNFIVPFTLSQFLFFHSPICSVLSCYFIFCFSGGEDSRSWKRLWLYLHCMINSWLPKLMTAYEQLVYAQPEIWGGSSEADGITSLYQTVRDESEPLTWLSSFLLEAERTLLYVASSSRCTQERS